LIALSLFWTFPGFWSRDFLHEVE